MHAKSGSILNPFQELSISFLNFVQEPMHKHLSTGKARPTKSCIPTHLLDLRRGDQELGGQLEVTVILHHARKLEVLHFAVGVGWGRVSNWQPWLGQRRGELLEQPHPTCPQPISSHSRAHIRTRTHARTYTRTHTHAHTHKHTHTHARACMHHPTPGPTFGMRSLSKLLKSGYSRDLEMDTMRSARKLNSTTAHEHGRSLG